MEEWRPSVGYEGLYEVSSMGRVRSVERIVWNGRGYRTVQEKILKPKKAKGGYLQVHLNKDGKDKLYLVHRLVAIAFISNPDNLPQVNHKDENKENNCVSNLEWCSHEYNNNYGSRTQKTSKPVIAIDKVSGLIIKFPSIMEASRVTGVSCGNIVHCCKGRYKYAGDYFWQYIE